MIQGVNFHKLEEKCTNIKKQQLDHQLKQFKQLTQTGHFKSIGSIVRGFNFFPPNLSTSLKTFFQPSQNLLNIESGTEEISTVSTQYSFYPVQQQIEEKIKEYNSVPLRNFVNESYFLYDKSDLIKETYITVFKKGLSIYGSITFLIKKTKNEAFKIISPEKLSKFFVNKDKNKE